MRCKQAWLDVAEVIDAHRLFPKLFLLALTVLAGWVIVYIVLWYCHLGGAERTMAVNGFCGIVVPSTIGLWTQAFCKYLEGGRDWTGTRTDTSVTKVEVKT